MNTSKQMDRWLTTEPAWRTEDRAALTTSTNTAALISALERILALASQAREPGRTDTDMLNALSAIQSAVFAGEMEYHGSDDQPLTDDEIPF